MDEFRGWKKAASALKMKYIEIWSVGNSVLDIGSGLGFYSEHMAVRYSNVVGVDVEKQYSPKKSKFTLARAENLPFRDCLFDTVFLFDVLEHSSNPDAVLSEVFRVGKRRLILSVPNSNDLFLPNYNLTFKHHKDKTHRREFTTEDIFSLLSNHGFSVISVTCENDVSPIVFAEFLRPRCLKRLYALVLRLMNKLKLFNLPKADIFVVASYKYDEVQ